MSRVYESRVSDCLDPRGVESNYREIASLVVVKYYYKLS